MRTLLLALGVAVVASPAVAQRQAPRLAGWIGKGAVQTQDLDGKCTAAQVTCTSILTGNPIPHAGGAAYDPRRRTLWVADRKALAEVTLADLAGPGTGAVPLASLGVETSNIAER